MDARATDTEFVDKVLFYVAKLYTFEKYCREQILSAEERHKTRQIDVPKYLSELKELLQNPGKIILPKIPFDAAIHYTISNWTVLSRYLDDDILNIDNNNCIENAIRPIALGRKNWSFAGSHEGVHRLAVLYSIFDTCKMYNINPYEYIKDELDKIKDYPLNAIKDLTRIE